MDVPVVSLDVVVAPCSPQHNTKQVHPYLRAKLPFREEAIYSQYHSVVYYQIYTHWLCPLTLSVLRKLPLSFGLDILRSLV